VKKTFTLSMAWLHTWCGLVFGWILFGVLLTGAIAVFHSEITYWTSPEVRGGLHPDRAATLEVGRSYLLAHAPESRLWRIDLPSGRSPALNVTWRNGKGETVARQLDPETGAVIQRKTDAGGFFLDYHYMLNIDRNRNLLGFMLVGLSGIAMLVACISGIVVHKRIFKDFFLFRPGASKHRAWLDGHNLLAVLPLPFHMMMAYTGIVILYWSYIPASVHVLYQGRTDAFRREAIALEYRDMKASPGDPAAMLPLGTLMTRAEARIGEGQTDYLYIRDPGRRNAVFEAYRAREDQVGQQVQQVALSAVSGAELRVRRDSPVAKAQSFVAALHFIEWGGPIVRWFYFLAGLMSAGMVAAGLTVFTHKRRRRDGTAPAWIVWVEKANVAAIAGLCVACAAFLWAERLTPANLADRIEIPVMAFFWVWAASLLHAVLRPAGRAWVEQLALAGLLCIGAPVLGGLGWRDLVTLDWVRLGMDVTLLIGGAAFLGMALKLGADRGAKAAKITGAGAQEQT
jgi:uncharacterized iron-regulated membrane protein